MFCCQTGGTFTTTTPPPYLSPPAAPEPQNPPEPTTENQGRGDEGHRTENAWFSPGCPTLSVLPQDRESEGGLRFSSCAALHLWVLKCDHVSLSLPGWGWQCTSIIHVIHEPETERPPSANQNQDLLEGPYPKS